MISILLNTCRWDESWAKAKVKETLQPGTVCMCALSFFDEVKSDKDWQREFGEKGLWRHPYEAPFRQAGFSSIVWINPFQDSAAQMKEKIINSSVLVLPGGAPERLMKRLKTYGLKKLVKNYPGTIIGVSAGAMVLLENFHITPDSDYPEYAEYAGLGRITGFDIEPHFKHSRIQLESMEKCRQKQLPAYGLWEDGGLIVKDGSMECIGRVQAF